MFHKLCLLYMSRNELVTITKSVSPSLFAYGYPSVIALILNFEVVVKMLRRASSVQQLVRGGSKYLIDNGMHCPHEAESCSVSLLAGNSPLPLHFQPLPARTNSSLFIPTVVVKQERWVSRSMIYNWVPSTLAVRLSLLSNRTSKGEG
jgi:hypothetical protein